MKKVRIFKYGGWKFLYESKEKYLNFNSNTINVWIRKN